MVGGTIGRKKSVLFSRNSRESGHFWMEANDGGSTDGGSIGSNTIGVIRDKERANQIAATIRHRAKNNVK